jgi:hypothetical protein
METFVGLKRLKEKQKEQLLAFEKWAEVDNWLAFHEAHYDWWMFPIDQPSRLGFAYTVNQSDIVTLKNDLEFMTNYLRGVELLLLSWGWELNKMCLIPEPKEDQTWHNWPIRLSKCAQSLELFECTEAYQSVVAYGRHLLSHGTDFTFRNKDLSQRFR